MACHSLADRMRTCASRWRHGLRGRCSIRTENSLSCASAGCTGRLYSAGRADSLRRSHLPSLSDPMARFFRTAERRQSFLRPPDMADWLPESDIVHLIVDAVSLMDLSGFEAQHKLGGAGQAPFAPRMLLTVLVHAYSHGERSSRAIERLCGRDAGYRFIIGEH